MKIRQSKPKAPKAAGFIRSTITIPGELGPFVEQRTAQPEYAGNFSAYVRSLILRDRGEKQPA